MKNIRRKTTYKKISKKNKIKPEEYQIEKNMVNRKLTK